MQRFQPLSACTAGTQKSASGKSSQPEGQRSINAYFDGAQQRQKAAAAAARPERPPQPPLPQALPPPRQIAASVRPPVAALPPPAPAAGAHQLLRSPARQPLAQLPPGSPGFGIRAPLARPLDRLTPAKRKEPGGGGSPDGFEFMMSQQDDFNETVTVGCGWAHPRAVGHAIRDSFLCSSLSPRSSPNIVV